MDRKQRRHFLDLEKYVLSKCDKTTRTNDIILTNNDFTEGRLDGA